MQFKINQNLFKDFPGLQIGIVLATNIDNSKKIDEVLKLFKNEQEKCKEKLKDKELSKLPYIESWREAYKKFGAKPKDHLSSVENLCKRVLKGEDLRSINTMVDLYNSVSIKYILPAGGEDLDKIEGNVLLTYATENEQPVKLLGEKEERAPQAGEVIYKDNKSAIVRRWNWKEAERTKLSENTKNAILVLEALQPVSKEMIEHAINELGYLIAKYCGGDVSVDVLDEHHCETILKRNDKFEKLKPVSYDESKSIKFTSLDNLVHTSLQNLSEEHHIRVQKVEQMREQGIEPWPAAKEVTDNAQKIINEFVEDQHKEYKVAGRIMTLRWHGKTAFANMQDETGKIQLYFKQEILGDKKFDELKNFIDIGDILWAKGTSFKTKTGEVTLKVEDYILLSKCLHPLPDKFHGIGDVEVRYRQRYLDLIVSPESKEKFIKRSKIVSGVRRFLETHNFMEVETPMLQPIPGGAAARPFVTHHNALDDEFYLRIAPELYLKRLVVGGIERVFELNRNFRNEGVSTRHNPEFSMLEFYMAYKDYHYAMDLVEELLQKVVNETNDSLQVPYGQHTIDFSKFERISIKNSVLKYGNLTETDISEENIDATLKNIKTKLDKKNASISEKIYALFESLVETKLIQPTFVTDFPIEISPLAKRDPRNPNIAARFELYIGGMEISNGFNELNDPFDQAERFKEQAEAKEAGDQEAHYYDADYILSLEYALPPTAGVGIGIDRVTMLLTNTTSIRDVILFPTLKKKN
jgi:lysyl-tRNA synthetase class 2